MENKTSKREYQFLDFFELEEIQKLQDLFSAATGVASLITSPEGVPITQQSGFSTFCVKVRTTEKGLYNCVLSDKLIGSPKEDGPRIQRCISSGLYDGGASIMVGNEHIANWLIGQVMDENCSEEDLVKYAQHIGLDDSNIKNDIDNITRMSVEQFEKVCIFLYYNAQLLSKLAAENLKQKKEIEKRLKTERLLKKEKEQFKVTISSIGDGVLMTDDSGIITFINKATEDITGWTLAEALGKPLDEVMVIIDEFTRIKQQNPAKIVLETGEKHELEDNTVLICKNGKEKYITDSAAPIMTADKKILGVVIVIKDSTIERMQERELINRDLRLTSMINNITDVIVILNLEDEVIFQSDNIKKVLGWEPEDFLNKKNYNIIHPDDGDYIEQEYNKIKKSTETITLKPIRMICKNGTVKYVKMSWTNMADDPNIGGILINFHDITERIELQNKNEEARAMIRNQQKLESIGTLASGVAHEINNPINGIMNYGQLILESESSDELNREFAGEILRETKRVSQIVRNLLQFSRQDKERYSQAMVDDVIEKTLSLINTILRHDQITLELDIQEDLPALECRSQQIQQVLMNFITNARDALNEKYPGYDENKKIIVTAKTQMLKDGTGIRIEVKDYGNGIAQKAKDRVFEPFFTTKDRTKGTGLGLTISYGIVQDHGGSLSYETKEGEYTKFIVDLPIRQTEKPD